MTRLGVQSADESRIAAQPQRTAEIELIELCDVHDRFSEGDRFAREWRSFDALAAGETMAFRADGTPIAAPEAGYIVFPNPGAVPGREWFYFARHGSRPLPNPLSGSRATG